MNVLLGNNIKGGSLFVPGWDLTSLGYTAYLYKYFGLYANEIGPVYPIWNYPTPEAPNAISQIITDMFFYCPGVDLAAYASPYVNVFMYVFDHIPSWSKDRKLGCYHTSELPFVFQRPPSPSVQFSQSEIKLAQTMSNFWRNFAYSSNPNGNGSIVWTQWTNSARNNVQIKTSELPQVRNFRSTFCSFWDSLLDQICFALPCKCNGDC